MSKKKKHKHQEQKTEPKTATGPQPIVLTQALLEPEPKPAVAAQPAAEPNQPAPPPEEPKPPVETPQAKIEVPAPAEPPAPEPSQPVTPPVETPQPKIILPEPLEPLTRESPREIAQPVETPQPKITLPEPLEPALIGSPQTVTPAAAQQPRTISLTISLPTAGAIFQAFQPQKNNLWRAIAGPGIPFVCFLILMIQPIVGVVCFFIAALSYCLYTFYLAQQRQEKTIWFMFLVFAAAGVVIGTVLTLLSKYLAFGLIFVLFPACIAWIPFGSDSSVFVLTVLHAATVTANGFLYLFYGCIAYHFRILATKGAIDHADA